MNAKDVQRYKRLLLAKLGELSAMHADAAPRALGAGGPMGDLADEANAEAEAELHIRLLLVRQAQLNATLTSTRTKRKSRHRQRMTSGSREAFSKVRQSLRESSGIPRRP